MYSPNPVPTDVNQIPAYLSGELQLIADDRLSASPQFGIEKTYKAPPKPYDGQLVYADGTHWNPGNGAGLYQYNGTSWKKLVTTQPSFSAQAGVATAVGNDVTYSAVTFDIGSNLNASNGRYTAPVSGVYFFRYHQLVSVDGEYRVAILKNGTKVPGYKFITYRSGGWNQVHAEGHVQMTAGDYVTIRLTVAAAALYTDLNYGTFSGHFIA